MTQKFWTPAEKQEVIEGFAGSNMKVPEYCKKKGISTSQFYSWQKAIRENAKPARKKTADNSEHKLRAQNEVLKEMLAEEIGKQAKAA